MTENTRTITYIGAALVLLIVAGVVNRKPVVETEETLVGRALFAEQLKSPDDVGGLEIVTSEDGVTANKFRVVRDSTGWSLPSHSNYPADAEKQVASAASSLIDLKVLSVVSTLPSEHAEYGVVDPEKATAGAEGIGKLVKVLDKSGNNLARLVIGKKDTKTGEGLDSEELWFVRALPHDAVYRVAMPSAKFSTSFADWIETDLLKLDPWDITEVTLKDYTFDIAPDLSGQIAQNYDQLSTIELAFNDRDSKWSLKKLIEFENDQPKPVELGADEELNTTRLNEMKTALDDLKIVGVHPKPAGMSANLKANKNIFNDREALQSLAERGFYAVLSEGGEPEILSSDGEVLVRMKDGVEYTLRFGGVASVGSEEKSEKAASDAKDTDKPDGDEKEDEDKATSLNRFIMVSARFNKDLIPPPELEPLPEGAGAKKADDKQKSDADEAKAPAPTVENKQPASESNQGGEEGAKSAEESSQPNSEHESAAAEGAEELHFVKLQAEPAESNAAKTAPGDADQAGKKKPSPEDVEELELERKRIQTENERKQKEYDEKIKKGESRARELNDRFADWYYVVSEATYRKIHLNRADVIKKKPEEKKTGDTDDNAAAATDSDSKADALEIPPLKADPFQKRDEANKEDAKENDE